MATTKKDLNFRKTANAPQGSFKPARAQAKVTGGMKPPKKGK